MPSVPTTTTTTTTNVPSSLSSLLSLLPITSSPIVSSSSHCYFQRHYFLLLLLLLLCWCSPLPNIIISTSGVLAAAVASPVQQSSSSSSNSPFLDVYLRVQPIDDFCGALQCNISYAISVLTNTQNQFDLQSVMLQDGHMTRRLDATTNRYFFEENTVVRLSDQLRRAHGKVYLGVMFFDVPDDIQDYLVVEVTDAIQLDRRAKTEFTSDTVRIGIQVYRRNEAATENSVQQEEQRNQSTNDNGNNGKNERKQLAAAEKVCTCAEKNCGCCEHVTVRKIHLDDEVCVNVTYISRDVGVRLALSVDNYIYYSKELSLRNPPPACFEVPHLREYASICVRLYDMEVKEDRLNGCSGIEAVLLHLRVARHKIGCFSIPI